MSDNVKLNMSTVHYELVSYEENVCSNNFWVDPFTGIILTAVSACYIHACFFTKITSMRISSSDSEWEKIGSLFRAIEETL